MVNALNNVGGIALCQGNFDQAQQWFQACVEASREERSDYLLGFSLGNLGAEYLFKSIQLNSFLQREESLTTYLFYAAPVENATFLQNVAIARAELGEENCQRAETEGKRMTLDQALSYAGDEIEDWSLPFNGRIKR